MPNNIKTGYLKDTLRDRMGIVKYSKSEDANGNVTIRFGGHNKVEQNQIQYNKNQNPNIGIYTKSLGIDVENGNNVKVKLPDGYASVFMKNCKNPDINANNEVYDNIQLENCKNAKMNIDSHDKVQYNNNPITNRGLEFVLNNKSCVYPKKGIIPAQKMAPTDRADTYRKNLFNGRTGATFNITQKTLSSDINPTVTLNIKIAAFKNGDRIIQTENETYIEYNSLKNPNIKIAACPTGVIDIENGDNLNIITTRDGSGCHLDNCKNVQIESENTRGNIFSLKKCQNVTANVKKYDTIYKDDVKLKLIDGENTINPTKRR